MQMDMFILARMYLLPSITKYYSNIITVATNNIL